MIRSPDAAKDGASGHDSCPVETATMHFGQPPRPLYALAAPPCSLELGIFAPDFG
jgi:hypothetical protein